LGRHLNTSEETAFPTIDKVEKLRPDGEQYAAYARPWTADARALRRRLERLGARFERDRRRVQGQRVDRARLMAAVLHSDPRVLMRRERRYRNDLFLGVLVDCSGSMQLEDRIETAKRFAVLVAEATKRVQGIESRFCGFTDEQIFDAGDASACAVPQLEAGGGNNDAAALAHMARLARGSRRSARVLVMISDGSPTECSVAALRALVGRLERGEGMGVGQVAVCSVEERCFSHYMDVTDMSQAQAVRSFADLVGELARRSILGVA
jgi:Mg-chelatase subunit ChlD